MYPPLTTAASLVPEASEVTEFQLLERELLCTQTTPEVVDTYKNPVEAAAKSLAPSAEDVIYFQGLEPEELALFVHAKPDVVEV